MKYDCSTTKQIVIYDGRSMFGYHTIFIRLLHDYRMTDDPKRLRNSYIYRNTVVLCIARASHDISRNGHEVEIYLRWWKGPVVYLCATYVRTMWKPIYLTLAVRLSRQMYDAYDEQLSYKFDRSLVLEEITPIFQCWHVCWNRHRIYQTTISVVGKHMNMCRNSWVMYSTWSWRVQTLTIKTRKRYIIIQPI